MNQVEPPLQEAIQLRREHLTLLQTTGSLQGSRLRHSYSEIDTRNVHLALNGQHEDYTEVLKFQQTSLDIKHGVSTLGLLWHSATN